MSDSSDSKENNRPDAASVDAYQQATLAIRSGYQRTHEAEHSEALFLTSSYVFENAELAARHFSNEIQGNVYSRYTNPTVRAFEQRLAAMEGGEQAVGTSSGMAATLSVVMALLQSGDIFSVPRMSLAVLA